MWYSRSDCKTVYLSRRCREIFQLPANSYLRKQKAIQAVVKQYDLSVYPFSRDKLVEILQQLLREAIFRSEYEARSAFPELFHPLAKKQETQQNPIPTSDIHGLIMEEIKESLETLLITGNYSDFSLISGGRTYAAHRCIICPRSPIIAKSCEWNKNNSERKLSSNDSDGHDTIAPLSFNFLDDDPLSVDCLVQYMYRLDYAGQFCARSKQLEQEGMPEEGSEYSVEELFHNGDFDLVLHVRVFALAEKYDIPHLKTLSLQKFNSTTIEHWGSAYMEDALREAYESTIPAVRGMRDAMLDVLCDYRGLLDEVYIEKVLLEVPHLALDLVKRLK